MNIQSTRLPVAARLSVAQGPTPPTERQCADKKTSFLEKTADFLVTGTRNTLQEGVLAAQNDPALAMRMAATTLSDTLLKKVDAPIKAGFDKTIVPVMRFALLGGNILRAHNTFTNPHSSRMERTIDAGVVISDLIGAAGGVAMLASTKHAELGQTLMGFSYAVDAISHAYRGLDHAGKRIEVWANASKKPKPQD